MPNMHKQRGRDRGKQYYYEHDDRDFIAGGSSDNVRRVSFKGTDRSYRRKNDNLQKKLSYAYILANDDIEMGGSSRRHDFVRSGSAPYHIGGRGFRGRGFRHPRDSPVPGGRRILQESSSSWYKVQISSAHNYDKDYVIGILLGYIRPLTFIPYGFKKTADDMSFFVDDFSIAEQLFSADWKITANDGNKLRLHVRPNMPFIEVDDKLKEKLKLVMSRRYQVATQALDLRKFYSDPEFLQEDIFVPLNRPNIMQAVVQIICDSIPELRALDLSDNKIGTLDNLKPLVDKTTQLKILHVADNKLRHTNQLESLQGLPLEDLNIDGNPVCDKFKNQEAYVREIRKRFPKVIKLDNTALPPPIVFDVEDNVTLLPSKGSFLCDVNGGTVVRQFLEQYYTIFDSESRQPLIDAYHENAQFSMTCAPGLTAYLPDSRNLCIVQGLEKRQRLLRQGRSTVLAFLNGFFKTQHDPASFAVDLVLFTPQLISLSLTGVYREPLTKKTPIRSFSRVFIIVPAGSGFCIVNDLLAISNATAEQVRDSFKIPVVPSTPAPAPAPPVMVSPIASGVISPPVVSPIASVPVVPNTVETRQQMISTLAMQTGMNFAWSEKCLNETNWNFDSALFVFSQLNKEGKVPAEAFVK